MPLSFCKGGEKRKNKNNKMMKKGGETLEKYEQAEIDYINGMKYQEIADKYNVSINTVKSWKKRHNWEKPSKSIKKKENAPTAPEKQKRVHPKKEMQIIEFEEPKEDEELSLEHQQFCVFYVKYHNATKAYQKVYECNYESAAVSANRLLKNDKIKNFIKELHESRMEKLLLDEQDIIQKYVDIAMADMHDFVTINEDGVEAVNPNMDGTLVKKIKNGKFGVEIQLHDSVKAMDKLYEIIKKQKAKDDEDEEHGVIMLAPVLEVEDESNMATTTETD